MVPYARRAGHLEVIDQPGKLTGEFLLVVAADHDLDTAVRRGTSHFKPSTERHPEHVHPVRRAPRPGLEWCSRAFDLVGDRAPALGEVEVSGPLHRIGGR